MNRIGDADFLMLEDRILDGPVREKESKIREGFEIGFGLVVGVAVASAIGAALFYAGVFALAFILR